MNKFKEDITPASEDVSDQTVNTHENIAKIVQLCIFIQASKGTYFLHFPSRKISMTRKTFQTNNRTERIAF